jgi:SAM-dependent methyltransferase
MIELADDLRAEFRAGFYEDRPAAWIDDPAFEEGASALDIEQRVNELRSGVREFAYPGHDGVVYRLLNALVAGQGLRLGADIGSATGVFPAMQLEAGIEGCVLFEVRETAVNHPGVDVRILDLSTAEGLQPEFDLVTCLSTIEHVGLGRYGDPLDPWGDLKLARGIERIVKPGGYLVVSFPVGAGCVVFNKHRVYSPLRRAALFEGFEVVSAHADRGEARRVLHEARMVVRGSAGAIRQPIYVLRPRRQPG